MSETVDVTAKRLLTSAAGAGGRKPPRTGIATAEPPSPRKRRKCLHCESDLPMKWLENYCSPVCIKGGPV